MREKDKVSIPYTKVDTPDTDEMALTRFEGAVRRVGTRRRKMGTEPLAGDIGLT